ncbi:MAG: hypothetical protein QXP42_02145 [Candidatus Micrarchaeia archaeon]
MKEVCRLGKDVVCKCGEKLTVDIETSLCIDSLQIEASCPNCRAAIRLTLNSFIRNERKDEVESVRYESPSGGSLLDRAESDESEDDEPIPFMGPISSE